MSSVTLPVLTLSQSAPASGTLIVGLADAASGPLLVGLPDAVSKAWQKAMGSPLLDAALAVGAKADIGRAVLLAAPGRLVVVTGLGPVDVTPEQVRRAVGNAIRALPTSGTAASGEVTVSLDLVEPEVVKGAAEGALLAAHRSARLARDAATPPCSAVTIVAPVRRETKDAVAAASAVAAAVCQAREWVNLPPNLLYPETFADLTREVGKEARLDVEVLDERALEKGGYGGHLAVGGGSQRPPRLVRATWAPRGATFHLALVGKGITFDSGGLDIKPADGMLTMKCDMAGAAAVIAAVRAIAELKLKVKVTAWAALAENMPSGSAYRPSDVITMRGGTTVENMNTDAEGRLVLADALARASEDAPDLVVDVATLTGAAMVALGARVAALMASDDATADHVLDAAESAGESFWHLPLPAHVDEGLKSKIADVRSTTGSRLGGALVAGAFLHRFVPDGRAWAHLDIAGPAWNDGEGYDYVPAGGTGSAVRTLVALASSLES